MPERFYELNNTAEQIDNILTDINDIMEDEVYDAPVVLKKGENGNRDYLTTSDSFSINANKGQILTGDDNNWIDASPFYLSKQIGIYDKEKGIYNENGVAYFLSSENYSSDMEPEFCFGSPIIKTVYSKRDPETEEIVSYDFYSQESQLKIKKSKAFFNDQAEIHIGSSETRNVNPIFDTPTNFKILNGASIEITGRFNNDLIRGEKPRFRIHGQACFDIDDGKGHDNTQIFPYAYNCFYDGTGKIFSERKNALGPELIIHDNPKIEISKNFYLIGHDDAYAEFCGNSTFQIKDTAAVVFQNSSNFGMQSWREDNNFSYGMPCFNMSGNAYINFMSDDYTSGPAIYGTPEQLCFSSTGWCKSSGNLGKYADPQRIENLWKLKYLLSKKTNGVILDSENEIDAEILSLIRDIYPNDYPGFMESTYNPDVNSYIRQEKIIKDENRELVSQAYCFLYEKGIEKKNNDDLANAQRIFYVLEQFLYFYDIKFYNTNCVADHIITPRDFYERVPDNLSQKSLLFVVKLEGDSLPSSTSDFVSSFITLISSYDEESIIDIVALRTALTDIRSMDNIRYFTSTLQKITYDNAILRDVYGETFPFPTQENDTTYSTYRGRNALTYTKEIDGQNKTFLRSYDLSDSVPLNKYSTFLYKRLENFCPNNFLFQGYSSASIGGGEGYTLIDIKSGKNLIDSVKLYLLDNSKTEIKDSSVLVMRGYPKGTPTYFDRIGDGALQFMSDSSVFVMCGAATKPTIPQDYFERTAGSPLFAMKNNGELRIEDNSFLQAKSNNGEIEFTFGDSTDDTKRVSFTLTQLQQLLDLITN